MQEEQPSPIASIDVHQLVDGKEIYRDNSEHGQSYREWLEATETSVNRRICDVPRTEVASLRIREQGVCRDNAGGNDLRTCRRSSPHRWDRYENDEGSELDEDFLNSSLATDIAKTLRAEVFRGY